MLWYYRLKEQKGTELTIEYSYDEKDLTGIIKIDLAKKEGTIIKPYIMEGDSDSLGEYMGRKLIAKLLVREEYRERMDNGKTGMIACG